MKLQARYGVFCLYQKILRCQADLDLSGQCGRICERRSHLGPDRRRPTLTSAFAVQEEDVCWICLEAGTTALPLGSMPCKCPRFAHDKCIARWQLQSAGTRKETHCEFCDSNLPDWKQTFRPPSDVNVAAIMNVTFNGITHGFEVVPGEEGYQKFTADIHRVFNLPAGSDLNITFTCDEPTDASSQLTLQGEGAYDAAVHCASLSAARRVANGGSVKTSQAIAGSKTIARWSGRLGSLKKRLST
eukprot:scaffold89465_cov47-Prasinocladus_malaysianus.AAC.1